MASEHEFREQAAQHRQRAGELYARHRSEGRDELLTQARAESSKASEFEERAQQAKGKKKDTFQRDGEASGDTDRRAWYEPGSVADDKLMQFEEARQGGILDEVTKYAARSVFDKEHRDFDGAKAVGKGLAAAGRGLSHVAKGARSVGRSILRQAAEHKKEPRLAQQGKPAAERSGRSQLRGAKARSQQTQGRTRRAKPEREPER